MSRQIELSVGRAKLSLFVQCGEIIGQQKWSETEVSSTGGGGHIGPQGGSFSAPKITSTTKTKQEIWIREEDGLESSVELTDKAFPVHPGQRVWLAYGANSNNLNSSKYLFAYNQASDRYFDFLNDWLPWLYSSGFIKKPLIYRLLTFWLSLFSSIIAVWIIMPLFSTLRESNTIPGGIFKVIDGISFPESYKLWLAVMSKTSTGDFVLLAVYMLALWLIVNLILKFFGRLLFLKFWERKQLDNIHKKVFIASKKLAGGYADASVTKSNSSD